jgi:hypothetical protein
MISMPPNTALQLLFTNICNTHTPIIGHLTAKGFHLDIASGYFNMPSQYINQLIAIMKRYNSVNIMAAGPSSNGFYGGKGLAQYVPDIYSQFTKYVIHVTLNTKLTALCSMYG